MAAVVAPSSGGAPANANCGYEPFPNSFDLSAGQCAPRPGPGGPVANPRAYPLGVGVPRPAPGVAQVQAQYGTPAHLPVQAPIAADVAKAQYAAGGYGGGGHQMPIVAPQQQQQQVAVPIEGAPQVDNVACHHHQQQQFTGVTDANRDNLMELAVKVHDKRLLGNLADDVKTRRYVDSIAFSLFEASHDGSVVRCAVGDGDIFRQRRLDPSGRGRAGHLGSGIIVGARLVELSSDCDVALIAKITGIRGNTYGIRSGKRGAFHVFPNSSKHYAGTQNGLVIHRMNDALDVRNMERYGHLNMQAVRNTVQRFPNESFSFVEITSPIIDVIQANENRLRLDLSSFPTLSGKYFVVSNDVVAATLMCLEREFFHRMPFNDLAKFCIEFERLDGKPWASTDGLAQYSTENDRLVQSSLLKRNTVSFALEIDYLLPRVAPGYGSTAPAAAAIGAQQQQAQATTQTSGGF